MSALTEVDHDRLRRAEQRWLRQSAERLRAAATRRGAAKRTTGAGEAR
ncbi:hypothetical protein GGQ22_16430 [Nocardioides sp. zg-579]|uniref:Uncharacterized protein n=1 Tax=Nocardioides marmotae TaxID=2663857 RepID=A0A6I3JEN0_9ACTN|nr:hypothetical protein [Nocardioides marmotae]MTB96664.1 hypothetical protein [Nocardioides marmotae]QKE03118.1 hypothetical protein HPC71_20180 [Nocardioides marmotae]